MTDESTAQNLVVREQRADLTAGGNVAALVPTNIEQAYRLATAMHASGLAPNTLNSVEKVLVAIMAGAELGLPPFQATQSFAVINGRPSIWGDGMLAVVRSHGFSVKEWAEGEDDARVAWCEVIRPDSGEVVRRDFSVGDARKANLWGKSGPWQTNPKRMLQMRARAFALRDAAADILRGFSMREEAEDYQEIRQARPQSSGLREKLEAQSERATEGFLIENGHEDTPEEVLAEVELPVTNTEALNDRPTRRPRRTKAEMEAARAAERSASDQATPSTETVTDASFEEPPGGVSAVDEHGFNEEQYRVNVHTPLGGGDIVLEMLDDIEDAEGLPGVSEAQDALDIASTAELPLDPPPSAVTAFINTVHGCASWADGKAMLAALTKTQDWVEAAPHEQRGARLALWNIPARIADKADPGADPVAFVCWVQQAPDEDQVDGTLAVLERSESWAHMQPVSHEKLRDAAAQAKRRIADSLAL